MSSLDKRKEGLLKTIVEEYTKTAEPVGSQTLANKFKPAISPATIRHEMSLLEEAGYIYQPHTSAGRIPSEKGFRFYIEKFTQAKQSENVIFSLEEQIELSDEVRAAVKAVARALAQISSETIIIGFKPRDTYFTGLANLFRKPEFANPETVANMSLVVDHLDEVMTSIYESINDQINVLIGEDNPFDHSCSAVMVRYSGLEDDGVIGILGPMRMDYETNISLIKSAQEVLNKNLND